MPVKKPRLYGISNSRLLPLALVWSPESELDIHSPPSPSSGVEGGRLLEYTNRLLDSCITISVSLRHRGRSATHTHTHLPLLPLILLHSSSSSCAPCLVLAPTEVEEYTWNMVGIIWHSYTFLTQLRACYKLPKNGWRARSQNHCTGIER